MEKVRHPGADALALKGWWYAYRYLLARRTVQLGMLGLFLSGPLFGYWIVKGNLASSLTLDVLPLTDPLVLLQALLTGQVPSTSAVIGVSIILFSYLVLGGRVYCSWVCPINMVTDAAAWLRNRLNIKGSAQLSRNNRHWLLGTILLLSAVTGTLVWELVNPVSMVYRGLIFGMGLAWGVVFAIFIFDLFVARSGWCGHLCPVGDFYGLLGHFSLLRVSAVNREQCNDCMDCFAVCPEVQVIRPALKGASKQVSPVITSGQCTNCGRCIDVCAKDVFEFTHRFKIDTSNFFATNNRRGVLP